MKFMPVVMFKPVVTPEPLSANVLLISQAHGDGRLRPRRLDPYLKVCV